MVFGYKASLGNLNLVDICKNTPKLVHISTLPYLIILIKDVSWGCNIVVYFHTMFLINLHSMWSQTFPSFLEILYVILHIVCNIAYSIPSLMTTLKT